jgi:hypothetical protein
VVLGIDGRPFTAQAQIVNAEPESAAIRNRARFSAPATEFLPLAEAPFQHSVDVDWSIAAHQEFADQATRSFQGPEQQLSWFDREPEPGPEPEPEPEMPRLSERSQRQETAPPPTPSRASFAPQRDSRTSPSGEGRDRAALMAAPVDLSDIIAHTDVELKRLGWTNAQGRRYLEQTYHKRSRQHLSDTELMEFLDYLKMQPAPSKSAR